MMDCAAVLPGAPVVSAALNELARSRLDCGVDLYLEIGQEEAGAPTPRMSWLPFRLDSSVMDVLLRQRACCAPGTDIQESVFPADFWRVGGIYHSLRVRRDAWSCTENRIGSAPVSSDVRFDHLIGALESPAPSLGGTCGASCFWYGGALICAASGTVQALKSIESDFPELVARQCEADMAVAVASCLGNRSVSAPSPARRVLRSL
jgi:hypothetical protein